MSEEKEVRIGITVPFDQYILLSRIAIKRNVSTIAELIESCLNKTFDCNDNCSPLTQFSTERQ